MRGRKRKRKEGEFCYKFYHPEQSHWLPVTDQNLPAEYTQDEVEHEEGTDHNEGEEVDPVEVTPKGVVRLQTG